MWPFSSFTHASICVAAVCEAAMCLGQTLQYGCEVGIRSGRCRMDLEIALGTLVVGIVLLYLGTVAQLSGSRLSWNDLELQALASGPVQEVPYLPGVFLS